ncbi:MULTISPECIES: sialidase family protein [Bradyrhizobium]|nr:MULTISPECIES: sialidase family protein [Bradyrhizobium]
MIIAAQQMDWSPSSPSFVVTNSSDTRIGCCYQDGDAVMAGYSEDGGRTWQKFTQLPQPPGTQGNDPWKMSFGTIAVSSSDTSNIVWEPSFDRAPFFTKDRGKTWKRVSFPGEKLPNTGSHEKYYYTRKTLAADRARGGVFYLVHSGGGSNQSLIGLWRTEDGGESWAKVFDREVAPRSGFSAKLRAVPNRAGHLFFTSGLNGGSDTILRRSIDGGVNWTSLSDVNRVDDIAFGKEATGAQYSAIYISGQVRGEYGIWRSTDNCDSWHRLVQFPMGALDQVTSIEASKDTFGLVYIGYMGSGWIYGQPGICNPAEYHRDQVLQCSKVD